MVSGLVLLHWVTKKLELIPKIDYSLSLPGAVSYISLSKVIPHRISPLPCYHVHRYSHCSSPVYADKDRTNCFKTDFLVFWLLQYLSSKMLSESHLQ